MAKNEPQIISRDYAIFIKKVKDTDRERNRVLMLTDFETGRSLPLALRRMQHDVLPSVDTPNIKISYEIVAMVSHEGMFSSSQDIPSVCFPVHITNDPMGTFDMGREGLAISMEKR